MTETQATRRRKRLIQQACKLSRKAAKASTIYREYRLYKQANSIFEQVIEEQTRILAEHSHDNQVQTCTGTSPSQI